MSKQRFAYLALALLVVAGCPSKPVVPPLKMLFIGNSLTFVNDLPGVLGAVATQEGHPIEATTRAVGGWTLAMHDADAETNSLIRKGGWDYVVLQEQSSLSVENPKAFHDAAVSLDAKIKAVGARTLLYQNWPLKNHPERQDEYQTQFQNLAEELSAQRVPAGDAWQLVRFDDEARWERLYADDRHPTPAGTYLTACVFYSVLFGAEPAHADPVLGQGPKNSIYYQTRAWTAVRALSTTAATH